MGYTEKILIPQISLGDNLNRDLLFSIDTDEKWSTPNKAGDYSATAWIPGNLLPDLTIYVSVSFITPLPRWTEKHSRKRRILVFNVYDKKEGDTAIGILNTSWDTHLRPKLKWGNYLG